MSVALKSRGLISTHLVVALCNLCMRVNLRSPLSLRPEHQDLFEYCLLDLFDRHRSSLDVMSVLSFLAACQDWSLKKNYIAI